MKKKGFTLIELLAVIVILAILALIAIPIIMNMINKARRAAAIDTAYGYVDSVEYSMNLSDIKAAGYENIDIKDQEYDIDDPDLENIKIKGKKPDSGVITIEKRKIQSGSFCIDEFKVDYDGRKAYIVNSNACKKGNNGEDDILPDPMAYEENPEIKVVDKVPCEMETETIDNKEVYYIDSVEDMYAFANSVNSGNTYEGKIVELRNNLDFSNYTSDKKTKVCNNGDNESGFTPIGTSSNSFLGTFKGKAKIIKNLTINRSSQNYVGIFGYIRGNIYGLRLKNIKVTGNDHVGSLAGYFGHNGNGGVYPHMYEIELDNVDVTGTGSNVGGLVGTATGFNSSWPAYMNNILVKSGKSSGKAVVGTYNDRLYNSDIIVEDMDSNVYDSLPTRYSEKVIADTAKTNQFPESDIGDLNFYESVGLDTWIGGDNNSSDYYFDYESATSNNIILKSKERFPMPSNLESAFESSNGYYLIKNELDWRKLAVFTGQNVNFKLTTSINFKNKNYYMLGSSYNTFIGVLNGGNNKISNVTIKATKADDIGLFGYLRGSVYGLIVDKINVIGNDNVGGVAGWFGQNGYDGLVPKMYEIEVRNVDVTGTKSNVGGVAGNATGYNSSWPAYMNNILVKSGKSSGKAVVGNYNDRLYTSAILVEDMDSKTFDSLPNRYSEKVIADNEKTNQFPNTDIGDINFYEAVGLDTWIGGDNNESGYYFDYENNKSNNIILKSVEDSSMPTNIDDTFESSDNYYLINNEEDWKNATAFVNSSPNFLINNNLNFDNKHFYMMGSEKNHYIGTLNAGGNKISNVTIKATKADYIGIFGYLRGNVYGLIIDNIKVIGNNNVGSLAGYFGHNGNGGVYPHMYEIEVRNVDVTGTGTYVGGVAGFTQGYNITWPAYMNNILVKSGKSSGKAVVGTYNDRLYNSGIIVEDMNSSIYDSLPTRYSEKVIADNEKTKQFPNTDIGDINFYEAVGLDTWIGGDNNESGYYFDYENSSSNNVTLKSIKNAPLPTSLDDTFESSNGYYLIKNTSDWKNATAFATKTPHFRLTSDLNFDNKHFYMMGSDNNWFNGIFHGGANTIKNVTIKATKADYIGLFGVMRLGSLYGLNIENIKTIGNDYVGSLAGWYGRGGEGGVVPVMYEVSIKNVDVNGSGSNVGGLIGYGSGFNISWPSYLNNILVKSGKSSGKAAVGNRTDRCYISSIIVERMDAKTSDATVNYYSENVKINGSNVSDGFASSNIDNVSFYSGKIETIIDGDNNNTGYYFAYDASKGGVYVVPKGAKGWIALSPKNPKENQRWAYYRVDGTKIDNGWGRSLTDFSGNLRDYYFKNGEVIKGWKQIDANWYYFSEIDDDNNGYIDFNKVYGGTMTIGNKTSTFDSDGVCTNNCGP